MRKMTEATSECVITRMFNIYILMMHGASMILLKMLKTNIAIKTKTKSYHIISVNTTKIDEKAMVRNRYKRIPQPFPDTIRERNTNSQDNIKQYSTSGKPRGH